MTLTREQILEMPAGPEMDAHVARLLGWGEPETGVFCRECLDPEVQHWWMTDGSGRYRCGETYEFSRNIASAWEVVRHVGGGDVWEITTSSEGTRVRLTGLPAMLAGAAPWTAAADGPGQEALCICRVALMSALETTPKP